MQVFRNTGNTISATDCKKGDIYVCMVISGSSKISVSNLNNCEIIRNDSAYGWESGSYQRSCAVLRCLDSNVSFTTNNTSDYGYWIRLRV